MTRVGRTYLLAMFFVLTIAVSPLDVSHANTCFNDETGEVEACRGEGPTSITPNQIVAPGVMPPSCHQAFPDQIPAGAENLPANMQYLNGKICQAYLYLERVYSPHGCSAEFDTKDGITSLNYVFAEHLYDMLQAANQAGYPLKINSGYRSDKAQSCANPNGFNGDVNASLHRKGLAADLQYQDALGTSAKGCDKGNTSPAYEWVSKASEANTYGIRLYNQNGHRTYVSGECNHVEISNPNAVPGGLGPGGAAVPAIARATSQPPPATSPVGICAQKYSDPRDFGNCVAAYQNIADKLKNPLYAAGYGNSCNSYYAAGQWHQVCLTSNTTNCASGDFLSSLFGGGSNNCGNSNAGFGSMMQLMKGMQLGQALGQAFGSLFNGSNNAGTQPASAPAPASQPAPQPAPVSSIQTLPPSGTQGTTPIDQLLASLGSTSSAVHANTPANASAAGTSNVLVSTGTLGQLEQQPGGISTSSPGSATGTIAASSSELLARLNLISVQLGNATASIAAASSTGSSSAILDAFNTIGGALSAIGDFLAGLFTPAATSMH